MSKQDLLRSVAGRLPPPLLVAVRYPREHLFVKGWAGFDSSAPSVVFFTMRKCASTLMRRMLREINARHLRLTPLNLAAYFWDTRSELGNDYLQQNARQLLRDSGIFYGPLRGYVDVSHLQQARVLAMLRDPRDVVVSGYYSARYSHREPANAAKRERFLANRRRVQEISIDDFARDYAPRVAAIYTSYREHLSREQVLTYEQMWEDFDTWARRLATLLGVSFSEAEIAKYRAMAGVGRQVVEDVHQHRRQGSPGDHRRKLSPGVIDELTVLFADTLRWLQAP